MDSVPNEEKAKLLYDNFFGKNSFDKFEREVKDENLGLIDPTLVSDESYIRITNEEIMEE